MALSNSPRSGEEQNNSLKTGSPLFIEPGAEGGSSQSDAILPPSRQHQQNSIISGEGEQLFFVVVAVSHAIDRLLQARARAYPH